MLTYLAAPYSGTPEEVSLRMQQFCDVDAFLIQNGLDTVSPLLKHFVIQGRDIRADWDYWRCYSHELIKRCDSLMVVTLDGWDKSTGVLAEIELAKTLGKYVAYINPTTKVIKETP